MIKLNYPKFWNSKNFISFLLTPFSWLYLLLSRIRTLFARPIKFPALVVCVGNITVGGSGKTQLIIWLANLLAKFKVNFVIITKGYGGKLANARLVTIDDDAKEVGDESVLLSRYGTVIASPKVKEVLPLIKTLKPSVILFDDGLQNPYFHKDFVILTIDPLRGLGNGLILPSGPLREKAVNAIDKADLILMIGNKLSNDFHLISQIITSNKAFYQARIKIKSIINRDKPYIAFTGIGNPDKFFLLLRESNVNIMQEIAYPDHYNYLESEIQKLTALAANKGASLITTLKDYVKLPKSYNIEFVDIELEFSQEEKIVNLIYDRIIQKT